MLLPLISGKSLSGWEGEVFSYLTQVFWWEGGREKSFLNLSKVFWWEGGRGLFLPYPRSLVGGREGGRGLFLPYPRSFVGEREGGRGLFLPYPRSFSGLTYPSRGAWLNAQSLASRSQCCPKCGTGRQHVPVGTKQENNDYSKHRRQSPDLFAAEIRKESDYDNIQC